MTSGATRTPKAEFPIDESLARALLKEQFPELADRKVAKTAEGWDNVMLRVGADLAMRMPRRQSAIVYLQNEQRWLPELAAKITLPTPCPIRIGRPGCGYPWPWTLQRWLPGRTANDAPPDASEARVLADCLLALHQPAPEDAPRHPHRGCPLTAVKKATEARLSRLAEQTEHVPAPLMGIWEAALHAPIDLQDTWISGDLHARNVVVHRGKISGIVDWGDICVGDAATDLAAFWLMFQDRMARSQAIAAYRMSPDTVARAKGWAIYFGAILYETGLTDTPENKAMGIAAFRNILEDKQRG